MNSKNMNLNYLAKAYIQYVKEDEVLRSVPSRKEYHRISIPILDLDLKLIYELFPKILADGGIQKDHGVLIQAYLSRQTK